jgi:hypothetical protein
VDIYYKMGKKVLEKSPFSRFKNKFLDLKLEPHKEMKLISLMNKGIFGQKNGRTYIKTTENEYILKNNAIMNNRVKDGDDVYFALYDIGGSTVCDFIEPYFENIEDLKYLK